MSEQHAETRAPWDANISGCGQYRYSLLRVVGEGDPLVWVEPIRTETRNATALNELLDWQKRAYAAEAEAGRLRFALAALVKVVYDGPMP